MMTSKIKSAKEGFCLPKGKLYTYKGVTGTLQYLCEVFKKDYKLVYGRISKGVPLEQAFDAPKRNIGRKSAQGSYPQYTYKGVTGTVNYLAKKFNMLQKTVQNRLNEGSPIEHAMISDTKAYQAVKKRYIGEQYTYRGITGSVEYLCYINDLSASVVRQRLKTNPSIERAFAKNLKKEIYTVHGQKGTLVELCKHFGLNELVVRQRLTRKYSLEEAFSKHGRAQQYTYEGVTDTIVNLCKHFNRKESTVRKRLERNYPIKIAMYPGRLTNTIIDDLLKDDH